MSDLQSQFEQASKDVKTLSSKPSNNDLLSLYSLYKQGSDGDCTGKRPGLQILKGEQNLMRGKK